MSVFDLLVCLVQCLIDVMPCERRLLIGAAAHRPVAGVRNHPEKKPLFANLCDVIEWVGNDQGSPQKGGYPSLWCAAQPAPI